MPEVDRAAVAAAVRAAAFECADEGWGGEAATVPQRRIVHSFLGGIGADWDEADVLALVADERNAVGWVDNVLDHQLRVDVPGDGRCRVYYFDVRRPTKQAAAAVDTSLEEALEAVLAGHGVPMFHIGAHDADRGDLASDLASAVRKWLDVTFTIELIEPAWAGTLPEFRNDLALAPSAIDRYEVVVSVCGKRALAFHACRGERQPDGRIMTLEQPGFDLLKQRLEVVSRG